MKYLSAILFISMILLLGCGAPASTIPITPNTQKPTVTSPAPKKITLTDAPTVLDLSVLLPGNFERIDAASESMSNKDLGLGPSFSEVELYLSEKPYQIIYCYLTIIDSRIQQATADALFKDDQQVKNVLTEGLNTSAKKAGIEMAMPDIEITHPNIGDSAVYGVGHLTSSGMVLGFDILVIKRNSVYVFIASIYMSQEKQSLLPIGKEIAYRIGMFSK